MNAPDRANILVVIFDSLGQSDVDALAGDLPTLSAFRETAVTFTNAYACSPESGPARASLFTGLDMAAHGVWTDGVPLPARETPFPERFAMAGYQTFLAGRRQLEGAANWTTEHARPHEYHHIDWAHGPLHRSRQNAYLAWLKDTAPDVYARAFPAEANPDDTDIPDAQRTAITDLPDALAFNTWVGARVSAGVAQAVTDAPFLGIASFVIGDTLGAAPHKTGIDRLNTWALRQADVALAGLLDDLPDDVCIVVTAARGTHSDQGALHETSIKVPLMIRHKEQASRIETGIVSTTDIAPTLYDITTFPPPRRIQGASLLRSRFRGWALSRLRNPHQPHQTALTKDAWKLVMHHRATDAFAPPTYQLFNLSADPSETQDVSSDPAHDQRLEDMIDHMIDARVALEDRTEPRIAKF